MDNLNDTTTAGQETQGLSDGEIIAVVLAGLVAIVIIVLVSVYCVYRRKKKNGPLYDNGMSQHVDPFPGTKVSDKSTRSKYPDISVQAAKSEAEMNKTGVGQMKAQSASIDKKGLDNPAYCEDDEVQSVRPKVQSSQQVMSTLERRKNRMDSNTAAVIAAERDRNTSVFSIYDTDNLIDSDAVIVSDQRTAL